MRYLTLAVLGIALFFAACSSSDESQSGARQTSQTDQQVSESVDSQPAVSQAAATEQTEQQTETETEQRQDAEESVTVSRSDEQAETQTQQARAATTQESQEGEQEAATAGGQVQQQAESSSDTSDEGQTQPEPVEGQSQAEEPSQAQQSQEQAEPMQPEDEEEAEQAETEPEPDPRPSETERLRLRAEEIAADATVADLTGIVRWLNGEETSIALELAKGNVVLIDFWTYTCINCIRTLPFLTEWHDKYAEHGLVIIGVHTPEFEFEKDPDNIRAAIAQYGIQYRVPQDDDYRTWRAFNNRYWPAKYLIGPTMDVRYLHFGEGDYHETEVAIREALIDAGRDVSGIPLGTTAVEPVRDPDRGRQTRELYGGTHRNYGRVQYAAQGEYYLQANADIFYEDIDTSREQREHHKWYLQGLWRNEPEAIVHARETQNLEDYLAFDFQARTVNVVLTVAEDGDPFDVFIEMDGRWLRSEEAGEHIRWDDQGRSYIRVTTNDLYRLVKLDVWSRHELKLRSNSDQLQIFAFTFGSYLGGE